MNGHVAEPEAQVIELPELERENVRDLTEPLNPTTTKPYQLTDVYSDSPALGRYFISAEVTPVSDGNKTAASYQLCFSVPPETEDFMRYQMSKEFVMNVLRQNIYDQEGIYGQDLPGCINMTLDPTSILLTQMQVANTED